MSAIVETNQPERKSLKSCGWYFEHKDDLHRMVNPSISRETLWFGTPGDAHTAAREVQDIIDGIGPDEETAGAPPTEAEMLKAHREQLQAAQDEMDEESDEASEAVDTDENSDLSQLAFTFDYSTLDGETRSVVLERTKEIHERVDHIRRHTVQIGTGLREVKARLGYGQFDAWLRAETPFSRDTADRLIQVADYVERSPQIASTLDRFSRSALYLLVAPSTPEAAREEATERAAAGERVTHAAAKEIVSKHRPARDKAKEPTDPRPPGDTPLQTTTPVEQAAPVEPQAREQEGEQLTEHADSLPETPADAPPPAQEEKRTRPRPEAAPASTVTAPPVDIKAWNESEITLNIQLLKHDGHKDGRSIIVSLSDGAGAPKIALFREVDLFDGRTMDDPATLLLFPRPVKEMLASLRAELPARRAAASARKRPGIPKPKPAAKAGKKAAPTKKATKSKAAAKKKPAAKKRAATTSPSQGAV